MNTYIQRTKNASDEYETPKDLFKELNNEFNFNLDPCSTDENCKCKNHYTIEDDGLTQNWGGIESFAIHHIAILVLGWKKRIGKDAKITQWWSC